MFKYKSELTPEHRLDEQWRSKKRQKPLNAVKQSFDHSRTVVQRFVTVSTDDLSHLTALFLLCSLAVQKVPTSNTEGGWSFSLAEYVRHNDMPIYEASERVLRAFQDELMPAESLSEFFDVVGQYLHAHLITSL